MPRVSYSSEDRARIRDTLMDTALELMARQGIQHTTVEQIYRAAGISRSFFYSFFPTREDLIVEALYRQQPRILAFARSLMDDPSLTWREGVVRFLHACCYGEKSGIAVMTLEEQQLLCRRMSEESYRAFRNKQQLLFSRLLACFGVPSDRDTVALFTNICLGAIILRRAIPESLPMFVPEAAEETVDFQIAAIADRLELLKARSSRER